MLAFSKISDIASLGNSYLGTHEFWNLIKAEESTGLPSPTNLHLLQELLVTNFELVRILSHLLQPYCPTIATTMLAIVEKSTVDHQSDALKFDLQRSIDIKQLSESLAKTKPYIAKVEVMSAEK